MGFVLCKGKRDCKCSLSMSILSNWAQHGIAVMNRRCHMMPSYCARITSRKHKVSLRECMGLRDFQNFKRHFSLVELFNIYLGKRTQCLAFIIHEEAFTLWLIFFLVKGKCWSRSLNGFSFQEVILSTCNDKNIFWKVALREAWFITVNIQYIW